MSLLELRIVLAGFGVWVYKEYFGEGGGGLVLVNISYYLVPTAEWTVLGLS